MSFPLQSFPQSFPLKGEVLCAMKQPRDYLLLFFVAALLPLYESSLCLPLLKGYQDRGPVKKMHQAVVIQVCVGGGGEEGRGLSVKYVDLKQHDSGHVINMLIKNKACKVKKSKSKIQRNVVTNRKRLTLFLY